MNNENGRKKHNKSKFKQGKIAKRKTKEEDRMTWTWIKNKLNKKRNTYKLYMKMKQTIKKEKKKKALLPGEKI